MPRTPESSSRPRSEPTTPSVSQNHQDLASALSPTSPPPSTTTRIEHGHAQSTSSPRDQHAHPRHDGFLSSNHIYVLGYVITIMIFVMGHTSRCDVFLSSRRSSRTCSSSTPSRHRLARRSRSSFRLSLSTRGYGPPRQQPLCSRDYLFSTSSLGFGQQFRTASSPITFDMINLQRLEGARTKPRCMVQVGGVLPHKIYNLFTSVHGRTTAPVEADLQWHHGELGRLATTCKYQYYK